MEVSTEFTEIVIKSEPVEPTSECLRNEVTAVSCNMKVETEDAASECSETSIEIGPVVKIEREYEDKTRVTHELVASYSDSSVCENKPLLLQDVKCEVESGDLEAESSTEDSAENCFDSVVCFESEELQIKIEGKSLDDSQMQSKVYYDSNHIKLVDVSVKLKDLFSSEMRKLGKAHSNTGSCLCIYCQGEYRYSQNILKSLCTENCPTECSLKPQEDFNLKTSKVNSSFKQPLISSLKMADTEKPSGCVGEKFEQKSAFDDYSSVEREQRWHECAKCPVKFKKLEGLKAHLSVHSSEQERPFRCEICPSKFKHKSDLMKHQYGHSAVKQFACKQCPSRFILKRTLTHHLKIHSDNRPFICDVCSKRFVRRCDLKKHLSTHSSERPFQCKICPAKYKRSNHLTEHNLSVHSRVKKFQCNECLAKFFRKSFLLDHIRVHTGEKPFQCQQCLAKFSTKSALYTHQTVHSGEKKFKCEKCGAKFARKSSLQKHLKKRSGEKPFQCDQCSKKFSRKYRLKSHMIKIHSGEILYKCSFCPSKFSKNSTLNAHLNFAHSAERPFECALCLSKFKAKPHLEIHIRRVHNREKSYVCKYCPAKFSQTSTAKRHMISHSSEKL